MAPRLSGGKDRPWADRGLSTWRWCLSGCAYSQCSQPQAHCRQFDFPPYDRDAQQPASCVILRSCDPATRSTGTGQHSALDPPSPLCTHPAPTKSTLAAVPQSHTTLIQSLLPPDLPFLGLILATKIHVHCVQCASPHHRIHRLSSSLFPPTPPFATLLAFASRRIAPPPSPDPSARSGHLTLSSLRKTPLPHLSIPHYREVV